MNNNRVNGIHYRLSRGLFLSTLIFVVLISCLLLNTKPTQASAGINQEVSFQGRLLNAQGATVPDGYYNIEFKIYQDGDGQSAGDTTGSPAGTLLWTEDYLNANGTGVKVVNGFMSVQLGSITPFGTNINWDQSTLWLSMNVAGTNTSCASFTSCSPDGEMLPMERLTASPYSLNSAMLGGLSSSQFIQMGQGLQTDNSANSSIYINKTGTGNLLDLQSGGNNVMVILNNGDVNIGNTTATNGILNVGSSGQFYVTSSGALTAVGINAGSGSITGTGGLAVTGNSTITGTLSNLTSLSSSGTITFSGLSTNGVVTVNGGQLGSTGTLSLVNGGTGSSLTANNGGIVYSSSSQLQILAGTSTSGLCLLSGANSTPAWGPCSSGSSNAVELAPSSAQTDASNYSSIFINKTGTGDLLELQNSGTDQFAINNTGAITVASGITSSGTITFSGLSTNGVVTVNGGQLSSTASLGVANGGTGLTATTAYALLAGGTTSTGQLQMLGTGTQGQILVSGGSSTLPSWTNTIQSIVSSAASLTILGTATGAAAPALVVTQNNVSTPTAAMTITQNTASSALSIISGSASSTGIYFNQGTAFTNLIASSSGNFTVTNSGNITFGEAATTIGMTPQSASNTTGGSLTVSAAGGNGAAAGGSLMLQGGTGGNTNGAGGNVVINGGTAGGTGTTGLVVLGTPTFSTNTNDPNCYTGGSMVSSSCTIAQATVDNYSAVKIGFTVSGLVATLPAPTNTTPGKVFYVTADPNTAAFTLSVNDGGVGNTVSLRANTTVTEIWNGSAWAAAGASSSIDLQAAYNNTLQSAGSAELVVSHTAYTNGLNIRDSMVNPVNGPLMTVQTNSAATLFSVSSNVTEFASDAGAETYGSSPTTFPSGTWNAFNGTTVSRYTTVGNYIASGQGSVSIVTSATANSGVSNTLTAALTANQHYNVSFAARLASGTFNDMFVYYSVDGSTESVACSTTQAIITSGWTKFNCSFIAPSSGITTSNAILIGQTSGVARTFYIDNLSVTIAADYNLATDGGVDSSSGFSTNWPAIGSATVSRSTSIGQAGGDSAQVVTTGAGQGIANLLSVAPQQNYLYLVTVYAASTTAGFNNFNVTYTPNGGTNTIGCVDYNTQSVSSSTSSFTEITCYIHTDSTTVTNPAVYFTQTDSTGRTFYVDTFSMTLSTVITPDVHIGGGVNGGPTTLFTLDSSASAPIASNNDSLLGSMYYDTTLGKIQCYEASGWGSCGSSSNTVVTISPEYTNAVLHGTGVGTMTSDFCSGSLHINDGTSGQPTICGPNDTYNFYEWTSPQATAQTYSIYVTYQLPLTYKTFESDATSLMARTNNTNSTVQYEVYREDASTGLTECGSTINVATGLVSGWQIGMASGAADPATCSFVPGDSIIFKIDTIASQNAYAYVGNLNFTFSNN